MMDFSIELGAVGNAEEIVQEEGTARSMGSGVLPVYATPAMVCLMESAAANLLDTMLPEGYTSVGISLQISHLAASPLGAKISARAEIVGVDKRKITFRISATDDIEEIGCGMHERFIVESEKFLQKAQKKQG